MMSSRRALWISTLLLLVVVAWLISNWPFYSLWYDETVNAYFAGQSWADIAEWCTRIDNQVPLDFALRKLWSSAAGSSEFALRALSFYCALLTAAGTLALGRRLGHSVIAGWLAVIALALSESYLFAAFQVRPYVLLLALLVWSSVVLWELWGRYSRGPLDQGYGLLLTVYLILALGMLYAHYTGLVALAAQGAYLGWRTLASPSRQRRIILTHIALGLIAGYLPWLVALHGRDVREATAYSSRIMPDVTIRNYIAFYIYGQQIPSPTTLPYAISTTAIIAGGALIFGLVHHKHRPSINGLVFAIFLTLLPLLAMAIMVYAIQGKLSGRHGWPFWIGAALLIGLGLSALLRLRMWQRWPLAIGALIVLSLPLRAQYQPLYNSQIREAFAYLNDHAEPGDVLVLRDGTLFTAAGYYQSTVPWIGLPPDKLTNVNRFLFLPEALQNLTSLIERHNARRVWVIAWQGDIMDPQDLVSGMLEYIGDPQPIERPFGDVYMSLYVLREHPDRLAEHVASLTPVVQTPPDGPIYLGGYILDQTPLPHGGIVRIHTWWRRGETVMPQMRVSVRLYSPDGTFYTQRDQPPVAWAFGQEIWQPQTPILSRFIIWIPYEIPAGPVEVKMILYDMRQTFEPITVDVASFVLQD